jgi:phosphoglycolate phosphatase
MKKNFLRDFMESAKKGLLIFDLDGTIADTLYSIMEAVNMCMEHYGFPQKSYSEIRAAVGNGAKMLIMNTMPESEAQNAERAEEIYRYFQSCYDKTHAHIDGCYDGMKEAMLELQARGYVLAVLSNKPDAYVKNIIGSLFDKEIIPIAMGETDLPRKPDPTAPLYIASTLGFEASECAFVGDSEVDIRTAQNSGMTSVAVSWGFRDRDALLSCTPDHIIDIPDKLLEIFE